MDALPQHIAIYQTEQGHCPYTAWYETLRDKRAKQRIAARILRLEIGNFGDSKSGGRRG